MDFIDKLQSILTSAEHTNLHPEVKKVLKFIQNYDNIPRKKPKFINFIKNISKGTQVHIIEKTWDVLQAEVKVQKEPEGEKEMKAEEKNDQKGEAEEGKEKKAGNEVEEEEKENVIEDKEEDKEVKAEDKAEAKAESEYSSYYSP